MIAPPPLILASASPRRAELLRSLGLEFQVVPGTAEELHDQSIPAGELCRINARRKAGQIARTFSEATILAADTLVARDGRIYGKPRDLAEAKQMLNELAGHEHEVSTAVCLLNQKQNRVEEFVDTTAVCFKALSSDVVDEYLRLVPVLDKAGAYGIQDRGEMLVERITGSFSNVMGLPAERLVEVLARWGYSPRTR